MPDMPISGDPIGEECQVCGDSDMIWEEYGSSDSDESELGTRCNTCDNRELPEEGYEYD